MSQNKFFVETLSLTTNEKNNNKVTITTEVSEDTNSNSVILNNKKITLKDNFTNKELSINENLDSLQIKDLLPDNSIVYDEKNRIISFIDESITEYDDTGCPLPNTNTIKLYELTNDLEIMTLLQKVNTFGKIFDFKFRKINFGSYKFGNNTICSAISNTLGSFSIDKLINDEYIKMNRQNALYEKYKGTDCEGDFPPYNGWLLSEEYQSGGWVDIDRAIHSYINDTYYDNTSSLSIRTKKFLETKRIILDLVLNYCSNLHTLNSDSKISDFGVKIVDKTTGQEFDKTIVKNNTYNFIGNSVRLSYNGKITYSNDELLEDLQCEDCTKVTFNTDTLNLQKTQNCVLNTTDEGNNHELMPKISLNPLNALLNLNSNIKNTIDPIHWTSGTSHITEQKYPGITQIRKQFSEDELKVEHLNVSRGFAFGAGDFFNGYATGGLFHNYLLWNKLYTEQEMSDYKLNEKSNNIYYGRASDSLFKEYWNENGEVFPNSDKNDTEIWNGTTWTLHNDGPQISRSFGLAGGKPYAGATAFGAKPLFGTEIPTPNPSSETPTEFSFSGVNSDTFFWDRNGWTRLLEVTPVQRRYAVSGVLEDVFEQIISNGIALTKDEAESCGASFFNDNNFNTNFDTDSGVRAYIRDGQKRLTYGENESISGQQDVGWYRYIRLSGFAYNGNRSYKTFALTDEVSQFASNVYEELSWTRIQHRSPINSPIGKKYSYEIVEFSAVDQGSWLYDPTKNYPIKAMGTCYVGNTCYGISCGGKTDNKLEGCYSSRTNLKYSYFDDTKYDEFSSSITPLTYEKNGSAWIRRDNLPESVAFHVGVGSNKNAVFWGGIHGSIEKLNIQITLPGCAGTDTNNNDNGNDSGLGGSGWNGTIFSLGGTHSPYGFLGIDNELRYTSFSTMFKDITGNYYFKCGDYRDINRDGIAQKDLSGNYSSPALIDSEFSYLVDPLNKWESNITPHGHITIVSYANDESISSTIFTSGFSWINESIITVLSGKGSPSVEELESNLENNDVGYIINNLNNPDSFNIYEKDYNALTDSNSLSTSITNYIPYKGNNFKQRSSGGNDQIWKYSGHPVNGGMWILSRPTIGENFYHPTNFFVSTPSVSSTFSTNEQFWERNSFQSAVGVKTQIYTGTETWMKQNFDNISWSASNHQDATFSFYIAKDGNGLLQYFDGNDKEKFIEKWRFPQISNVIESIILSDISGDNYFNGSFPYIKINDDYIPANEVIQLYTGTRSEGKFKDYIGKNDGIENLDTLFTTHISPYQYTTTSALSNNFSTWLSSSSGTHFQPKAYIDQVNSYFDNSAIGTIPTYPFVFQNNQQTASIVDRALLWPWCDLLDGDVCNPAKPGQVTWQYDIDGGLWVAETLSRDLIPTCTEDPACLATSVEIKRKFINPFTGAIEYVERNERPEDIKVTTLKYDIKNTAQFFVVNIPEHIKEVEVYSWGPGTGSVRCGLVQWGGGGGGFAMIKRDASFFNGSLSFYIGKQSIGYPSNEDTWVKRFNDPNYILYATGSQRNYATAGWGGLFGTNCMEGLNGIGTIGDILEPGEIGESGKSLWPLGPFIYLFICVFHYFGFTVYGGKAGGTSYGGGGRSSNRVPEQWPGGGGAGWMDAGSVLCGTTPAQATYNGANGGIFIKYLKRTNNVISTNNTKEVVYEDVTFLDPEITETCIKYDDSYWQEKFRIRKYKENQKIFEYEITYAEKSENNEVSNSGTVTLQDYSQSWFLYAPFTPPSEAFNIVTIPTGFLTYTTTYTMSITGNNLLPSVLADSNCNVTRPINRERSIDISKWCNKPLHGWSQKEWTEPISTILATDWDRKVIGYDTKISSLSGDAIENEEYNIYPYRHTDLCDIINNGHHQYLPNNINGSSCNISSNTIWWYTVPSTISTQSNVNFFKRRHTSILSDIISFTNTDPSGNIISTINGIDDGIEIVSCISNGNEATISKALLVNGNSNGLLGFEMGRSSCIDFNGDNILTLNSSKDDLVYSSDLKKQIPDFDTVRKSWPWNILLNDYGRHGNTSFTDAFDELGNYWFAIGNGSSQNDYRTRSVYVIAKVPLSKLNNFKKLSVAKSLVISLEDIYEIYAKDIAKSYNQEEYIVKTKPETKMREAIEQAVGVLKGENYFDIFSILFDDYYFDISSPNIPSNILNDINYITPKDGSGNVNGSYQILPQELSSSYVPSIIQDLIIETSNDINCVDSITCNPFDEVSGNSKWTQHNHDEWVSPFIESPFSGKVSQGGFDIWTTAGSNARWGNKIWTEATSKPNESDIYLSNKSQKLIINKYRNSLALLILKSSLAIKDYDETNIEKIQVYNSYDEFLYNLSDYSSDQIEKLKQSLSFSGECEEASVIVTDPKPTKSPLLLTIDEIQKYPGRYENIEWDWCGTIPLYTYTGLDGIERTTFDINEVPTKKRTIIFFQKDSTQRVITNFNNINSGTIVVEGIGRGGPGTQFGAYSMGAKGGNSGSYFKKFIDTTNEDFRGGIFIETGSTDAVVYNDYIESDTPIEYARARGAINAWVSPIATLNPLEEINPLDEAIIGNQSLGTNGPGLSVGAIPTNIQRFHHFNKNAYRYDVSSFPSTGGTYTLINTGSPPSNNTSSSAYFNSFNNGNPSPLSLNDARGQRIDIHAGTGVAVDMGFLNPGTNFTAHYSILQVTHLVVPGTTPDITSYITPYEIEGETIYPVAHIYYEENIAPATTSQVSACSGMFYDICGENLDIDDKYTEWSTSFIQEYFAPQISKETGRKERKGYIKHGDSINLQSTTYFDSPKIIDINKIIGYDWKRYDDGVGLGGDVPLLSNMYDSSDISCNSFQETYVGQIAFGTPDQAIIAGGFTVENNGNTSIEQTLYNSLTTGMTFKWNRYIINPEDKMNKNYNHRSFSPFFSNDEQTNVESTFGMIIFDTSEEVTIERQGSAVFEGQTRYKVVFNPEIDEAFINDYKYSIVLSPNSNIKVWWENKSSTGFDIVSEDSNWKGVIDWQIFSVTKVPAEEVDSDTLFDSQETFQKFYDI